MTGLDPRARQMLRTYRRERTRSDADRDALWGRIETSIDAGDDAEHELDAAVEKPRRRVAALVALSFGVVGVAAVGVLPQFWTGPVVADPVVEAEPSRPAEPTPAIGDPIPRASDSVPDEVGGDHGLEPAAVQPRVKTATSRRKPERPQPAAQLQPATPSVATADALKEEMRLIHRARAALRRGEPAQALEALDEHTRRFPSGQMREDQAALQVEALCGLGKAVEANRRAKRFATEFPRSAHVGRVQGLCANEKSVP